MTSKLTDHLKALLLGGAVAITTSQSASAANTEPDPAKSLEGRIEKIRQQVNELPASDSFRTGNGPQSDADLMWWRNAWGNGGWHNWHNGWGNGGWGWRNWHNW